MGRPQRPTDTPAVPFILCILLNACEFVLLAFASRPKSYSIAWEYSLGKLNTSINAALRSCLFDVLKNAISIRIRTGSLLLCVEHVNLSLIMIRSWLKSPSSPAWTWLKNPPSPAWTWPKNPWSPAWTGLTLGMLGSSNLPLHPHGHPGAETVRTFGALELRRSHNLTNYLPPLTILRLLTESYNGEAPRWRIGWRVSLSVARKVVQV